MLAAMTLKLHHFFILTEPGAACAQYLSAIGLNEGSSNNHPGQGTANRRFFFANTTLELLYLSDAQEAETGRASRLRFGERASKADASPFGLIVSETPGHETDSEPSSFSNWLYCPEYFEADQCFRVGTNSDLLSEPLCICMPDNLPVSASALPVGNPDWVLSELRISLPVKQVSSVLQSFANCDGVTLILNQPQCLELTFNRFRTGQTKDFRPDLPLGLHW